MDGVAEPSRELDARVATMMGREVWQHGRHWYRVRDNGDQYGEMPRFSKDLTAMQLVIDHFKGRYWWQGRTPVSEGGEHMAGFTQFGATGWNGRPDYQGFGSSLPHATVLAALQIDEGEEIRAFADLVRHGRKDQGIALHELAQRLGWGIPRVSEIERAVGQAPTVEERAQLLAALAIEV